MNTAACADVGQNITASLLDLFSKCLRLIEYVSLLKKCLEQDSSSVTHVSTYLTNV